MITSNLGRRLAVTLAAILAAVVGLIVLRVPGAFGAYTAKDTNSTNTAATSPYFTCTAAVMGESATNRAYFAYPFNDTGLIGLLPAADVSGNGNNGSYTAFGVTYGVTNAAPAACPRDNTKVITLDGANGYVSGPNASLAGSNVLTEEIWFKTTTAAGKLIGFGNARTGTSGSNDRNLYINTSGQVVFGVFPNNTVKVVTSPKTYTDGTWHQAVATLSSAGMALYLDGALVASDATTTSAEIFSGYWRIGYDNLNGWPGSGSGYFKGSLSFAAVYNTYALTAAQVAAHYAAGH